MTSITEPIDLPDLRSYLSMEPDDTSEDPFLTDAISFCRDRLESILPYFLAERDVTASKELCSWCLMPLVDIPLRGPVLEIQRVAVVMSDRTEMTCPDKSWYLFDGMFTLDLREALADADTDAKPVGVTVEYHAGSHVPPVVRNALLMMVRNRYERRDEDPLTEGIESMVYPETRINI